MVFKNTNQTIKGMHNRSGLRDGALLYLTPSYITIQGCGFNSTNATRLVKALVEDCATPKKKPARPPVVCDYCKKTGHVLEKCFKRQHDLAKGSSGEVKQVQPSGNGLPPP